MSGTYDTQVRRARGSRGSGMVLALVLIFASTAGALVWLARDVDRAIAARSSANAVAFQAARSAAQRLDTNWIRRTDAGETLRIDQREASAAAHATASRVLAGQGLAGRLVSVVVDGPDVVVTVEVTEAGRTVIGVGAARATREAPR